MLCVIRVAGDKLNSSRLFDAVSIKIQGSDFTLKNIAGCFVVYGKNDT